MNKNSTWSCEGTPNEPHSVKVYDVSEIDCSICGSSRPSSSANSSRRTQGGKGILVPLAIAVACLGGVGGIVAWQAENIEPLCKPLGNCVSFRESLQSAQKFSKNGEQTLQSAKSIADLEAAKQYFERANKRLKDVPQNSALFAEATKLNESNDKNIVLISDRLKQETIAADLLKSGKALAVKAEKFTKPSSKDAEIAKKQVKENIDLWKQAEAKVNQISAKSFIASEKPTLISLYKKKQKELDAQMVAIEQEQRDKLAEIARANSEAANRPEVQPPVTFSPPPSDNSYSPPPATYAPPPATYSPPPSRPNRPPLWGPGSPGYGR